ncbi:MAG: PIN domain-containing protein, partial [Anaerolineales bacterium]
MATWAIQQILKVFSVAEINGTVLENAIMLGWADFEDALQATAAQGAACNYVITRNTRDFDNQPLAALRPADFLAIWASGEEQLRTDLLNRGIEYRQTKSPKSMHTIRYIILTLPPRRSWGILGATGKIMYREVLKRFPGLN